MQIAWMKTIEIYYHAKRNKWIADPIYKQPDAELGIGSTPLEALGDLICRDCLEHNIIIKKIHIKRSDLADPPQEVLQD